MFVTLGDLLGIGELAKPEILEVTKRPDRAAGRHLLMVSFFAKVHRFESG